MSQIGLLKIMDTLLVKEYPGLTGIKVVPLRDIDNTTFRLFIGITPEQMEKYGSINIRNSVQSLAKFVLNDDEKVITLFYNSEDFE